MTLRLSRSSHSVLGSEPPRLLLGWLTPNPGGIETFILAAIRALRDNYDIFVLTFEDAPARGSEVKKLGATIITLTHPLHNPARYLHELISLFRAQQFQVLWVNHCIAHIHELVIASMMGVPQRIIHAHQSANMFGFLHGVVHRVQRWIIPLVSTQRFACAEEAAKWFYPWGSWTFVPNVIDPLRFAFDPERRAAARARLGISPDRLVILHVGRLAPEKNQILGVHLVSELCRLGHDVELLLCGEGPDRRPLSRYLAEHSLENRVRLLGTRDDVPDLYRAADLAILPSKFEGLPFVGLEAQACGLPLLASTLIDRDMECGGRVHWLDIDGGISSWVAAVDTVIKEASDRNYNPIVGTDFDISTAPDRFRDLVDR